MLTNFVSCLDKFRFPVHQGSQREVPFFFFFFFFLLSSTDVSPLSPFCFSSFSLIFFLFFSFSSFPFFLFFFSFPFSFLLHFILFYFIFFSFLLFGLLQVRGNFLSLYYSSCRLSPFPWSICHMDTCLVTLSTPHGSLTMCPSPMVPYGSPWSCHVTPPHVSPDTWCLNKHKIMTISEFNEIRLGN